MGSLIYCRAVQDCCFENSNAREGPIKANPCNLIWHPRASAYLHNKSAIPSRACLNNVLYEDDKLSQMVYRFTVDILLCWFGNEL